MAQIQKTTRHFIDFILLCLKEILGVWLAIIANMITPQKFVRVTVSGVYYTKGGGEDEKTGCGCECGNGECQC